MLSVVRCESFLPLYLSLFSFYPTIPGSKQYLHHFVFSSLVTFMVIIRSALKHHYGFSLVLLAKLYCDVGWSLYAKLKCQNASCTKTNCLKTNVCVRIKHTVPSCGFSLFLVSATSWNTQNFVQILYKHAFTVCQKVWQVFRELHRINGDINRLNGSSTRKV